MTSNTRLSILKPGRPREPLQDLSQLIPNNEEEETTTTDNHKRRVSFAAVNKVKEFETGAECTTLHQTPAYDERFSISSDSYQSSMSEYSHNKSTFITSGDASVSMNYSKVNDENINIVEIIHNVSKGAPSPGKMSAGDSSMDITSVIVRGEHEYTDYDSNSETYYPLNLTKSRQSTQFNVRPEDNDDNDILETSSMETTEALPCFMTETIVTDFESFNQTMDISVEEIGVEEDNNHRPSMNSARADKIFHLRESTALITEKDVQFTVDAFDDVKDSRVQENIFLEKQVVSLPPVESSAMEEDTSLNFQNCIVDKENLMTFENTEIVERDMDISISKSFIQAKDTYCFVSDVFEEVTEKDIQSTDGAIENREKDIIPSENTETDIENHEKHIMHSENINHKEKNVDTFENVITEEPISLIVKNNGQEKNLLPAKSMTIEMERNPSQSQVESVIIDENEQQSVENTVINGSTQLQLVQSPVAKENAQLKPVQSHIAEESAQLKPVQSPIAVRGAQLQLVQSLVAEENTQLQPVQSPVAEENAQLKPVQSLVAEENAQLQPVQSPVAEENTQLKPVQSLVAEENAQLKPVQSPIAVRGAQLKPVQNLVAEKNAQLQPVQSPVAEENLQLKPVQSLVAEENAQLQPVQSPVAVRGAQLKPVQSPVAVRGAQLKSVQSLVADENAQLQPVQSPIGEEIAQLHPVQTPVNKDEEQLEPVESPVVEEKEQLQPIQNPVEEDEEQLVPVQIPVLLESALNLMAEESNLLQDEILSVELQNCQLIENTQIEEEEDLHLDQNKTEEEIHVTNIAIAEEKIPPLPKNVTSAEKTISDALVNENEILEEKISQHETSVVEMESLNAADNFDKNDNINVQPSEKCTENVISSRPPKRKSDSFEPEIPPPEPSPKRPNTEVNLEIVQKNEMVRKQIEAAIKSKEIPCWTVVSLNDTEWKFGALWNRLNLIITLAENDTKCISKLRFIKKDSGIGDEILKVAIAPIIRKYRKKMDELCGKVEDVAIFMKMTLSSINFAQRFAEDFNEIIEFESISLDNGFASFLVANYKSHLRAKIQVDMRNIEDFSDSSLQVIQNIGNLDETLVRRIFFEARGDFNFFSKFVDNLNRKLNS